MFMQGALQGAAQPPAFVPSRIVTLSELPEAEREQFMRFLADSRASVRGPKISATSRERGRPPFLTPNSHLLSSLLQFFKDADGSYAANIRLYDPGTMPEFSIKVGPQTASSEGAPNLPSLLLPYLHSLLSQFLPGCERGAISRAHRGLSRPFRLSWRL